MSHRSLVLAVALAAVILIALPAAGQTPSGKASTVPRTPDGKPDLQGIWTDNTLTPFERPKALGAKEFYNDQELADLAKKARTGAIGEEGDLGAARPQEARYDLELYGFDATK